jgi:hypothetical protein
VNYDVEFYRTQMVGSERSARAILPLVFELLSPTSVIDYGCGVGAWLRVARSLGVTRVRGLDGSYVDRSLLEIDPGEFCSVDLENADPEPGFDLAMSLEVAEHLGLEASSRLVAALTGSADAVLFGAAIPGQRGANHVNCQWQSWWAERFVSRGFLAFDLIRPRVWGRGEIDYHYAQNTILYVRKTRYESDRRLRGLEPAAVADLGTLDKVHPDLYGYYLRKHWSGVRGWLRKARAHTPPELWKPPRTAN